jgi:hypothetical protein
MIPALPLIGKILADFTASGSGAVAAPQDSDPKKVGAAANAGDDFTQAVDDLQRAAAAGTTPHGAHGATRS